MPFVKLDCGILNSTLWFDKMCRDVFLTALLMAEPLEITEPTPQIAVRSLDLTGFIVMPGWYGFVPAAGIGILHRAQVTETEMGIQGLERLGEPEISSRSKDFDGRRLVRVNGGFIVLNYMAYRERDYTAAERSKRYRTRLQESRRSVTASHRNITQAEVEVEVEEEAEVIPTKKHLVLSDHASADADFERFRQAYPVSRRIGGKQGHSAFKTATVHRNGTHFAAMLAALEQHKRSEQWQTPKLIPLMTTWLRQERWNQVLPESTPPPQSRAWCLHTPVCKGEQAHRKKLAVEHAGA